MTLRFLRMGALTLAGVVAACTGNITGPEDSPGGPGGPGPTDGMTPGITDPEVIGIAEKLKLNGTPAYLRVVRLTNEQWTNSVQTILGLPSPPTHAEAFANPVVGLNDFSNNEKFDGSG